MARAARYRTCDTGRKERQKNVRSCYWIQPLEALLAGVEAVAGTGNTSMQVQAHLGILLLLLKETQFLDVDAEPIQKVACETGRGAAGSPALNRMSKIPSE